MRTQTALHSSVLAAFLSGCAPAPTGEPINWFGPYSSDPATDPKGPADGSERVPRGGSWMSTSRGIRLPNRNLIEPGDANFNIGFRCVREPV